MTGVVQSDRPEDVDQNLEPFSTTQVALLI